MNTFTSIYNRLAYLIGGFTKSVEEGVRRADKDG
jgi:hypothetical protein